MNKAVVGPERVKKPASKVIPGVSMPEEPLASVGQMDLSEVTEAEIGLTELARRCGVHRVTLLRMEQRGEIAKARWRRRPIPHRVYNEAEIQAVLAVLGTKGNDADRNFVE